MFSSVLKQVIGGVKKRLVLGTNKSKFGQTVVAQEENVVCNLRMSKFPFHICDGLSCKAEDFLAGARGMLLLQISLISMSHNLLPDITIAT
jgi:hypothetical protein